MTDKKPCCCCKKKVVKKRKPTVGKKKMTAKEIVATPVRALPAPYLFGADAMGELQKFSEKPVVKPEVKTVKSVETSTFVPAMPSKYKRNLPTIAKFEEKVIEEPSPNRKLDFIKEKMKVESEPYSTILGVNVPVKREGQYIKKETGLFTTRLSTNTEKKEAMKQKKEDMMKKKGQMKLDKFFTQ